MSTENTNPLANIYETADSVVYNSYLYRVGDLIKLNDGRVAEYLEGELGDHGFDITWTYKIDTIYPNATTQLYIRYHSGSPYDQSNMRGFIGCKQVASGGSIYKTTVTFNKNGGTGTTTNLPSTLTMTYGSTDYYAYDPLSNIARTGYVFTGWYTATSGGTKIYDVSGRCVKGTAYWDSTEKWCYNASTTLTLYAQWQELTYTVSYNANGGSDAPGSQTKRYTQNLTLSSAKPSRTGYTFKQWNTKSDGTGTGYSSGGTYSTNASVTLYAIWTANKYTITYKSNGGSGSDQTQTATYGTAWTTKGAIFSRTGYTQKSWNRNSNDSGTSYGLSAVQTNKQLENLTLYAIWQINTYSNTIGHWVSGFKNQEGTNSAKTHYRIGTSNFNANYNSSFSMNSSKAVNIPNGCSLKEFGTSYIDGTWKLYPIGTTVTQKNSSAGFDYYYAPIDYTITYDLAGGENNSANPSTYNVLYGVTFKEPTRTNYKFLGWFVGNTRITGVNEGKNAAFASSDVLYSELSKRSTGNISITAKWEPLNVAYCKIVDIYKLCNSYIKVDGVYKRAIMYQKVDGVYRRSGVAESVFCLSDNDAYLSDTDDGLIEI